VPVAKPKRIWVPLDNLVRDPGLQMRTSLPDGLTDPATVERYREAILEGEEFPPLEAVFDDKTYWLFDGFQRAAAMELAGKGSVECLVFAGAHQDALLRAIAANAHHGLTRSVNDCRRALTTLLDTPELLQKVLVHAKERGGVHLALATTCCISKGLVYKVLEERNLRVVGGKIVKKGTLTIQNNSSGLDSSAAVSSNSKRADVSRRPGPSQSEAGNPANADSAPQEDSVDIRELERARTAVVSVWTACRRLLEGAYSSNLLRCAANHRIPFTRKEASNLPGTAKSLRDMRSEITGWEPLEKIEAVLSDLAAAVCGGIDPEE
jgi:hypothetical protein